MKATIVPKAVRIPKAHVPKLEPTQRVSRQATGGDVTKIGKVKATEGPRP
jgi:hypothetical protein